MNTYRLKFAFTQYYYTTIDATDYEEAQNKASTIDIQDCELDTYSDWETLTIQKLEHPPLTEFQKAFIQAYEDGVGDAPLYAVIDYLFDKPVDSEYYTSIADAYNIWDFACKYQREKTK